MVSILIPAFREADRIGRTLAAVRRGAAALEEPVEVVVVDDGSDDGTAAQALAADGATGRRGEGATGRRGDPTTAGAGMSLTLSSAPSPRPPVPPSPRPLVLRLVRLERNRGKGAALARGLAEAGGEWIVMLDADLAETAAEFPRLLAPVRAGLADMTIAVLPDTLPVPSSSRPLVARGGFGLALRMARWGVARLTGRVLAAPLSGQRAFAAAHIPRLTPLEPGFGLEVGLDIDALWAGLRVLEVPTTMAHVATGRDWAGFRHRGRQLLHILRTLARRALRAAKTHHKGRQGSAL